MKGKRMRFIKHLLMTLVLLTAATGISPAAESRYDINLDVKEFTLDNGMQFLVVERSATPQIAFRLAIRAGSALEDRGKTGIAHLLEHMMFKGTSNFGTLDPKKDKELQDRIEDAYQIIQAEEQKRQPDKTLIEAKRAEMENLRLEVQKIYIPQSFSSQLGRNGAVGVNAFTSRDQTQYMSSMPSDMVEQWFSIVSEQIFEPSWREFYVEKEIVQREWAFRYINNPEGAAWLDLNTAAYIAHPYRNPTIGWKSDMEKYSTEDAVAFHKKYYNPSNAVCVLVGDVTLEKARDLAQTYFGRYPAGEHAPEEVTREPLQEGPRKSVRYLKGARTPLLRIGFHGARMGTRDFYALDALTMILSQGRSARLTRDIVNNGLAADAWAYNPDNRYAGMLILGGTPNDPESLKDPSLSESEKRRAYMKACEELEERLLAQVERFKSDPVSERELKRIKKLNHRDFLEKMRKNEDLAATLATMEVQIGWRYLETYLEELDKVTPEDIRQAAQKYFRRDGRTSAYVLPGGDPDRPAEQYTEVRSLSGSAAGKAARPATLTNYSRYPTPQGWKHPLSFDRRPEKIQYPRAEIARADGATVFYLPDRELPLIDLTLLFKAGSVDVDHTLTGLTDLFNESLILGGTERYAPQDLALALDENAIHFTVSVGEEAAAVHLSVMKEDWETGLHILRETLTRPRFDPEVLQVVKDHILTALKRQSGDARAVAGREIGIWHFKGHPYGQDPLEALTTIPKITGADLKRFLKTYFVPSNMVVSVSGDIEKTRIVKDLAELFEALPGVKAPERKLDDPSETPPVLTLIHKPGQIQSQVRLALPSIKRTHPDYWKVMLLANIFGGRDSMLYTRLRDDLGLVYSTYFFQTFKWQAGLLGGYIGCKGDMTASAIEETVRIMASLAKDIPAKDLEQKRLDVLNSFVFNVDTPAALVDVYAQYHLRGEPLDTLERIQEAYIGAKKAELETLAGKFLVPGKLQIFVVADKTTPVPLEDGSRVTLEEGLKALAERLGLPYRELPLR